MIDSPRAPALPLALAMLLSAPAALRAEGPPGDTAPAEEPRGFSDGLALAAEAGWHKGLAVGAELGWGPLAARLTGGGNLVGLMVQDAETYQLQSLHLFATGQVNADVAVFPIRTAVGAELGLSGGYRFNTLLGSGFAGALEARRALGDRLGLYAMIGISYYPDGKERVVEKEDFPPDVKFNIPLGAEVQYGLGVGMTYAL